MRVRRIFATVVGITQGVIGVLAGVFAFILYFNFLDVQTALKVSTRLLPLYVLSLGVFSFFSVISGFFLIHEELE